MLNQLTLGTANFLKTYGFQSSVLTENMRQAVLQHALASGISYIDTALAYGGLESMLGLINPASFQIMTKFSVRDDFKKIAQCLKLAHSAWGGYTGVLVHDPHNITPECLEDVRDFLTRIKASGWVKQVGVSVYTHADVEAFHAVLCPDVIQIPLNPFNQEFLTQSFQRYCEAHCIEVHARSLFLQGVLLQDTLPSRLSKLNTLWVAYQDLIQGNALSALLSWAHHQTWVHRWVVGVNTVAEWRTLIQTAEQLKHESSIDFSELKALHCAEVDPRMWSMA